MPLTVDETHFTNAPSSLADLIGQIREAFQQFADATPVLVGKKHLEHGAGSAPRVVFVPEVSGKVTSPIVMGRPAALVHGCTVHVRGKESGDDLTRFRSAENLAKFVIDMIATGGSGRIEWGNYDDNSPVDSDAYGAEILLTFTFRHDVLHSEKRWPPGLPGILKELDATVEPKNGS